MVYDAIEVSWTSIFVEAETGAGWIVWIGIVYSSISAYVLDINTAYAVVAGAACGVYCIVLHSL